MIEFHDKFSREDTDALWDLGVCMDDYDYVLIVHDTSFLTSVEYEETETEWEWYPSVPQDERVWPREQVSPTSYRVLEPPYGKGRYVERRVTRTRYESTEYGMDRLLTGRCSNQWYLVEWKGEQVAIGVAYHA